MQARSPGSAVLYAAYGFIAVIAVVLITALQMPAMGARFAAAGADIEAVIEGQAPVRLKPGDRVVFETGGLRLEQTAGELVPDFTPPGRGEAITRWYGERDLLVRMARNGPVTLTLPGQPSLTLAPSPRGLLSLSMDVWLLLLQATVIGLLGVWLVVLKPRDPGARMFAVSCLGVTLAAFSGAVFDARELTADGTLLRVMQGVNFVGSNVCATGMLAIFLCQPRRLVPDWAPPVLVAAGVLYGLASAFALIPLSAFYLGLIVPCVGYLGVLGLQGLRSRGDPAARASVAWVGVTTLLGMSVLTIGMAAPPLLGLPSPGGDGMSFLPLFIVYGGIAFGVGGYRLFDLDRWTTRVLLGVAATFGLLALDALLISAIGMGGQLALALSLLIIGFLYLPMRGLIWRKVAGRAGMSESQLFQAAAEVAFSPSRDERPLRWRGLLARLFDPLEISADPAPAAEAVLRDGGVALALPAVADDVGLILRYRDQGRRLFGGAQQALARELVVLMRNAERTRDEYERGVRDERGRIARDLHDDVAAPLLTSLHRQDVGEVRSDVRKAMAEIRTIVSSLTGGQISVDEALAAMRAETAERLEAAGVALRWPVSPADQPGQLPWRAWRHLASAHREVVSNIIKHAAATEVAVEAGVTGGRLTVAVHDNGKGLGRNHDGGNGLENLRTRLSEARGAVSLPDCAVGTRVEMWLPIEAP